MWDLFDFNNDGIVCLVEKVIGVQLLEGSFYDNSTASNDNDYCDADDDDYCDADDDEIDEDDELDESALSDNDNDFNNEDSEI